MTDSEYRQLKNEVQKMNKRVKELREAGFKYDLDFKLPLSLSKSKLEENAKIAAKINADPKSYISNYKTKTPPPEPVRKETWEEKKARQKAEKKKYREAKKKKKKELKQQQREEKKKLEETIKAFGGVQKKSKKQRKEEKEIIERANKRAKELEKLKLEKKSQAYQTQKEILRKRAKQQYGDEWTSEDSKRLYDAPLVFKNVEDAKRFLEEKTSQAETTFRAIHKTFSTIRRNDKSGIVKTQDDEQLLMLLLEKDNGAKFKNTNYGSDVALNEYKIMLKEYKRDLEEGQLTKKDYEIMEYIKNNQYKTIKQRARR